MSAAWPIGAQHPHYREVEAMGVTGGEVYRWFVDSEGCVAMIPLDMLEGEGE